MTSNLIDSDKQFVRRINLARLAGESATLLGDGTLHQEMATQRLAAAGWFWSDDARDFVHVAG